MSTVGRTTIGTVGNSISLSADGQPEYKVGGITLDWGSVTAVSGADLVLEDGVTVLIGEKAVRYGQVLCRITQAEVQTVDLSGDDDPTGGTWDMTILGQTITGIAWNVSAADLQTAIRALSATGASGVTVSKTLFVYTVTFPGSAGNVAAITGDPTNLTGGGGDTFAITVLTTTGGVATYGKYAPYDPAATDGRAVLARGSAFIVNCTVKENDHASDHPPVLDGGRVFKDRLIQSGVATHTLADGPTFAELLAAFPRLSFVSETPQ